MRPLDPAEVGRAVERAYRDLDAELPLRDRIQRWVFEAIARLFEFATENQLVGFLVLAAVAAGVIWFVQWALRRGLVSEVDTASTAHGEPRVDWEALARDAEARGDLDAALRAGYRALLADLVARGWVPDRRSLTASEARAAVSDRRAGVADSVRDATSAFERVAYARDEVNEDDVAAMRRARQEVGA